MSFNLCGRYPVINFSPQRGLPGAHPKDAGLEALKRIRFFALNAKREYAGVAVYACCLRARPRSEAGDGR